ncbi:MAG: glycosyltransferase [Opitutaceae bacterium]|nr:glycosyltransferase [Opitutaceae bacterium]
METASDRNRKGENPIVSSRPLRVAYLFTTFPKSTETFLQREVLAMQSLGADLQVHSLWKGGGDFNGIEVRRFQLWRLLSLIWIIPWVTVTRWELMSRLLRGLFSRRAPSWINFWENMLGAGFAGVMAGEFRRDKPDLVHAAWAGGPATAGWILSRLTGVRFSSAAHAYDIYEHGGDWWLMEKLRDAAFVHTSTEMACATLVSRGLERGRIQVIRRGLVAFPPMKALREARDPLRIISIARLVEKKGLARQLEIYAALVKAGMRFEARILGDGPLMESLMQRCRELRLDGVVTFCGHCTQEEVACALAWADVLVHTGVVSASGDRDGLPNVIPEAMAAGVVVVTSTAAATTEAITDRESGRAIAIGDVDAWVSGVRELKDDAALCERLRTAARVWVEREFDAHRNASRLHRLFMDARVEARVDGLPGK